MTHQLLGTCGRCGGSVTVPTIWHGVIPPVPTCQSCGAVPRSALLPVLEMAEPPREATGSSSPGTSGPLPSPSSSRRRASSPVTENRMSLGKVSRNWDGLVEWLEGQS